MPGPPASPPPPMLLLLLLLTVGCARAAPLPQTGAGEVPVVEVPSLFVILSVCSLLILIVLIANCVSCCKDPEIDFKEFEDNFDDEIDFTPPAEDTPSIQSPAEVFTLSVPNISLPAPSQFQASVEGLKSQVARHSLNYTQEDRPCTLASTGTNTNELLAYMSSTLDKSLPSHLESSKLKEPDIEGKYLGKLCVSGMLDLSEDGMDADEEDENSDDSDEDLRAFNLHSLSSESEDDTEHPVPIIVSNDDGRHLRSLLKPSAAEAIEQLPEDWKKEKKAVTFFDDVTVYLFDQETPTKELGHCGGEAHGPGPSSPAASSSSPYLGRCMNSESSTDEEGGGFEWDDDFSPDPFMSKTTSLLGSKPSLQTSKYFSPPPPARSAEQSWPHVSPCSRFSISPANIASFSLTHLTDSDIEQGGSSEDGDKD